MHLSLVAVSRGAQENKLLGVRSGLSRVAQITEIQEGHGVHLTELTDTTTEISDRVNKVNQDTGGAMGGRRDGCDGGRCFSRFLLVAYRGEE